MKHYKGYLISTHFALVPLHFHQTETNFLTSTNLYFVDNNRFLQMIDEDKGKQIMFHSLFYRYTPLGRSTNTDNYKSLQTLKYDMFFFGMVQNLFIFSSFHFIPFGCAIGG